MYNKSIFNKRMRNLIRKLDNAMYYRANEKERYTTLEGIRLTFENVRVLKRIVSLLEMEEYDKILSQKYDKEVYDILKKFQLEVEVVKERYY